MMPIPQVWMDLASQVSITGGTSTADAYLTVPADANLASSLNTAAAARSHMSLWYIAVGGVPCYVNAGAVATTANAQLPVGLVGPLELPVGTVIHAITAAGTGTLSIIRARLS